MKKESHYAELEIGLQGHGLGRYSVDLRFSQPESDADIRLSRGEPALVDFDHDRLLRLALQPAEYGQALSTALFAEPAVHTTFTQARSTAQTLDLPLRVRLSIGPNAARLHDLRWETLRDPDSGDSLVTNERIIFSRYLSSFDWTPVQLRARSELRALVMIANPGDLSEYQPGGQVLAPVDVAGELARARAGLDDIPVTALAARGEATLAGLGAALRDGYDILYLVCHGALIDGEPYLWLEEPDGQASVVAGSDLVLRLRELQQRPRLVVLASCQSAGSGGVSHTTDGGALAALGPRLAEAAIPAVLAMQGNITMQTVAAFMPVFFAELRRDGQIDRAMAVARGVVRDHDDWWMPVLFMRLKSGRIWYVPGFGEDGGDFEKWPALVRNIQRENCTPLLGPNLAGMVPGAPEEIARRWAEHYRFPLAPHQQEDLAQVAQFLAVSQDFHFPREEFLEDLRGDLLDQYGMDLPEDLHDADLEMLLKAVCALYRERNPADPYHVLAGLPFPVYVTANFSNALTEALVAAGKTPQVEICRWNADLEGLPSIFDDDPDYAPDVQSPLVYHLFGHFREPESLVITEDDYFDFLIGVTANKDLIPITVREALIDKGLLFLGFKLDTWSFRVLFRSLISQEGRGRRKRYAHVAAQVTPEEGRMLEPERARQYLNSYFQDADIDIFWGSVDEFVQTLLSNMQEDTRSRRTRRRS